MDKHNAIFACLPSVTELDFSNVKHKSSVSQHLPLNNTIKAIKKTSCHDVKWFGHWYRLNNKPLMEINVYIFCSLKSVP